MSDDKIALALGLPPINEITMHDFIEPKDTDIVIQETLPSDVTQQEVIDDTSKAKDNIKNIIDKGTNSLEKLLHIANVSENIKAFEVASGMIKALVDANKDYVSISERKKYAKDEKNSSPNTNITNNNLILSTTDLLKMLKGDKNEL